MAIPVNTLGTLSPVEIVLDCLQYLKLKFPIITQIATDFSSDAVKYNQEIITRVVTPQAAQDYDPVTNGYGPANTAATVDIPVTINKHKFVRFTFTEDALSETPRNLVQEQISAAAYSLGLAVVNDLMALITPTNFPDVIHIGPQVQNGTTTSGSATVTGLTTTEDIDSGMPVSGTGVPTGAVVATVVSNTSVTLSLAATASGTVALTFTSPGGDFDRDTVLAARQQLVTIGAESANRFGLVTPAGFSSLAEDVAVFAKLYTGTDIDFDGGTLEGFAGFEKIMESAIMPAGVQGFFGNKSALLCAARVPIDPGSTVPGIVIPGTIETVKDPLTGLAFSYRYWYDFNLGTLNMVLTFMYGVAIGVAGQGVIVEM